MSTHSVGWSATPRTAPAADESLIARARTEGLDPGQPFSALFINPSEKSKGFLDGLAPRARAALQNAARTIE